MAHIRHDPRAQQYTIGQNFWAVDFDSDYAVRMRRMGYVWNPNTEHWEKPGLLSPDYQQWDKGVMDYTPPPEHLMSGPEVTYPQEPTGPEQTFPGQPRYKTTGLREYEGSYYGRPPIAHRASDKIVKKGFVVTPEEQQAKAELQTLLREEAARKREDQIREAELQDAIRREQVPPPSVQTANLPRQPQPERLTNVINMPQPKTPKPMDLPPFVSPLVSEPYTQSGVGTSMDLPGEGRITDGQLHLDESTWGDWFEQERQRERDRALDFDNIDEQVRPYGLLPPQEDRGLFRVANAASPTIRTAAGVELVPVATYKLDKSTINEMGREPSYGNTAYLTKEAAAGLTALMSKYKQETGDGIVLESAFREEDHNQALRRLYGTRVAQNSTHKDGLAIDISARRYPEVVKWMKQYGREYGWHFGHHKGNTGHFEYIGK